MNNQPKFSIIIPCLNSEKTIQRTIDSIKKQNYKNFECLVMDGGSKDSTMDIIKKNSDVVTTYISEEDNAISAVNKGIKISKGDYIIFLYSDDYIENNFLKTISENIDENNSYNVFSYGLSIEDLITSKKKIICNNKKNIKFSYDNVFFKHVLNHVYKSSLFEKYGLLTESTNNNELFYSNDREFIIRIFLGGEKNFVIDKVLYKMTSHDNSNTGSRKNIVRIRYEHIEIANNYLKKYKLSRHQKNKFTIFKSHNLILLLAWYFIKFDIKNFSVIFFQGYKNRGIYWILDLIIRPFKELFYRFSIISW